MVTPQCSQGSGSEFQSAPRSEERGDPADPSGLPTSSEFQSAPRSEERGDANLESGRAPNCSFNPRPAPRSGAMLKPRDNTNSTPEFQSAPRSEERGDGQPFLKILKILTVSIRAPLRGAGRCCNFRTRRSTSSFNPRPAPRSGAIPRASAARSPIRCFNPRPAPRSGAIFRQLDRRFG